MTDVVIIDNGGANIASLRHALRRLGATSQLTADPRAIRAGRRVILPGVGAAGDAMHRLRVLELIETIPLLRQPVLGICLGMQLLFAVSEEGGDGDGTDCLGIIAERVSLLTGRPDLPVPHMGWNQLHLTGDTPLMNGIDEGEYVYFVHSYAAPVGPYTVATTNYGGEFSAAVRHENFHGVQFHPERSARVGSRVLANFLELR
ncbi:MAG TPA: imidazole glycerol phosphate synthase subunit HisH [Steroidobacteraceae bacterium]